MDYSKIHLNGPQITGTPDCSVLVLEVRNRPKYVNGKRTDETEGVSVIVVCPSNDYEKLSIKMDNCSITNEQIAKNGAPIKARLKGCVGKFYRMTSGELGISVSAEGIEVIS